MSAKDFEPWWERVNNYIVFHELEEFKQGALGYRPNSRQEALMGLISAGYVRKTFEQPKSYTGKKK